MRFCKARGSGGSSPYLARQMNNWKALLLIYREIDVRYSVSRRSREHFAHCLTREDIEEAENSFRHFPPLVCELTDGRTAIDYAIVHVQQPLRSLSAISWGGFWPSPKDVRRELE